MKALALIAGNRNVSEKPPCTEPTIPRAEMEQLYALGYHLLPCGGEDGKRPLRKGWNGERTGRMPLETVISIMKANNSRTYGVRLDGLTVVDCDSWNEATQDYVRRNIPETEFEVSTSRGRHFYFRSGDPVPTTSGIETVKIDFKSGKTHFVVGPGSVRPDGKTYLPRSDRFPGRDELCRFRFVGVVPEASPAIAPDHVQPCESGSVLATQAFTRNPISKGQRNKAAFKQACSLAVDGLSQDEMVEQLALWVKVHCEDPEGVLSDEIKRICVSACKRRTEGKLYSGRKSEFKIARPAWDLVMRECRRQASNCWLLYSFLVSNHGHFANRPFVIVADAMAKSSHLPLSKSTIDRCKQELKRVGLIRLLRKGKPMEPDQFVLAPLALIDTGNMT